MEAPSFGGLKKALLQNIAIQCGAELLSQAAGRKLDDFEPSVFGTTKTVTAAKDGSVVLGGSGGVEDFKERLQERTAEQTVDTPVLQLQKEIVEATQLNPQERFAEHEQIIDVPIPPLMEEQNVEVAKVTPGHVPGEVTQQVEVAARSRLDEVSRVLGNKGSDPGDTRAQRPRTPQWTPEEWRVFFTAMVTGSIPRSPLCDAARRRGRGEGGGRCCSSPWGPLLLVGVVSLPSRVSSTRQTTLEAPLSCTPFA